MAERIKDVINTVFKKLDEADQERKISAKDILEAWPEVSGSRPEKHTKPASLRRGRLVINVDGSAWLYALTLRKTEFLEKFKKKFGEDKIKELQFRIGEIK